MEDIKEYKLKFEEMLKQQILEAENMEEEIEVKEDNIEGDLQTINTTTSEPAQLNFFSWLDKHTSKEKGKSFYKWLSDSL